MLDLDIHQNELVTLVGWTGRRDYSYHHTTTKRNIELWELYT